MAELTAAATLRSSVFAQVPREEVAAYGTEPAGTLYRLEEGTVRFFASAFEEEDGVQARATEFCKFMGHPGTVPSYGGKTHETRESEAGRKLFDLADAAAGSIETVRADTDINIHPLGVFALLDPTPSLDVLSQGTDNEFAWVACSGPAKP